MNAFESAFMRKLDARLEEVMAAKRIAVMDGAGVTSFEKYREEVGYTRALQDVRGWMGDVERGLTQEAKR